MNENLRMSDAEREQAAADLGEHFAQGRLTATEHAERLDQIWAAKTHGELAPIFRDLPSMYAVGRRGQRTSAGTSTGRRPSRGWSEPRRRRGIPAPLFVLVAALVVVTIIANVPFLLIGLAILAFLLLKGGACHGPRHSSWR